MKKTEQYKCQSYYDDNNALIDCTCGKCALKPLPKEKAYGLRFSLKDFKDKGGYLSYTGKNCEICLEPCLNGCDMAVYDLRQGLLEPKVCTDLKGFDLGDKPNIFQLVKLWKKVSETVNKYYKNYEVVSSPPDLKEKG